MKKLIHIKKLGLAFYKDDFVRIEKNNINPCGIYIYYQNGKYSYIVCKSKRQANLWCTLIVQKIEESENEL